MTKGARIKSRRQHLGISQTDLAIKVGITKQQMYKYENDIITNIPSDKMELIADALNVSPSYLMGWESQDFRIKSAKSNISAEDLRFALWGGADGMDDDDLKAVLDYAEFLKQRKNR